MEKERKEEEKKKEEGIREEEEIQVWKLILVSLELWFGTSLLFGTLVFLSMKPICMVCWLGNPLSSFFAYVWGLKNSISI